jgi:ATP-dependent RNA helicase RhlE
LILTPTRELAIQIDESFAAYGKNLNLKHLVIFGGVSQGPQTNALRNGVDILIATPGRLLDLVEQRYINLSQIQLFVLDEADRMLDMGFIHDVKKIITKIPAKRQTLFFSATMPTEIAKLSSTILDNPAKVQVTPVSSTAETIQQSMYFVEKDNKKHLLIHLLKDKTIKSALVFTRTKHGADKVVKELSRAGIGAEAIHGNKSQNARQRALGNFKSGHTRVLVATDIAARGIDVDNLSHVINYELPNIPETYVHRIGRTGRAGASGIAFSFCDMEEKEFLRDIQKLITTSGASSNRTSLCYERYIIHLQISYRKTCVQRIITMKEDLSGVATAGGIQTTAILTGTGN